MSFEAVDIFVKDTTALQQPISGVVVKLMNQAGTLTYGFATTDGDGKASFLLEAPVTYQVRLFKAQVNFINPKLLAIVENPSSPAVNQFDISGEVFVPPVSPNPRLCVASGIFRKPNGAPAPHVDMHFIAKFDPILLEEDAVITERMSVRTDKNGYAEITLIRNGEYDVTLEGFEDSLRLARVPDLPNVNLPDLLFPRVEAIELSPPGPYTIAVGEDLILTPTVAASDGNLLEGAATEDVQWGSTDHNVLGVLLTTNTVTIRGIGPGTAQLTVVRNDCSIIRIPNTPIEGQPVTVTVV